MRKIAIIGGGPAGMMAAGAAASRGEEVTLFEKNEKLGRKLFITGKGRCNITNAAPIEDFFDNIMSNKNFMYSSLYTFTNDSMIEFLRKYKVATKIERGNRVFPESNKSSDVIRAFERYLKDNKVELKLNTQVKHIKHDGSLFYLETNEGLFAYEKVVIATGGKSYPKTGSTGDGYEFAKKFKHNITEILPSLVPIEIKEEGLAKDLQGLSLRNVKISAHVAGKKVYEDFGEMVFTHYGISGPIVLSMSTFLYPYLGQDIQIKLDLKPSLTEQTLDKRILRDFEKFHNKSAKNSLDELLPAKLRPRMLKMANIDEYKKVHQITKEEREKLLKNLKEFTMTFKLFRPINEAIITSGGVDVNEIDPSTMESKLMKGLYFAGEVLDVDALTGGYNLQIAYSTGYLAGTNI